MKKIILTLVFVFAMGSFTQGNANNEIFNNTNKVPNHIKKNVFPISKVFDSEKFLEFINNLEIDNTAKIITLQTDCGLFADVGATVAYLSGANYWSAWFYLFGYCVENLE
jgi:hypothetical protein